MWNKYQTQEERLNIDSLPDEVREEFYECLSIPFIKWIVSPDRPRACDLPRDSKGRIIVDVTKPHILEDMDYFRPTAIHFQKTGRLTDLKPNGNPNSAYGKWIIEEVRRCREGYVRESDGEWVPGNMYYFLNYFPIAQTKTVVGSNKGKRIIDFPEVWDGNYLRYHYIEQAQHGGLFNWEGGLNGAEISARGKTKSLSMAAIMSKYFTLGESDDINKAVKVMAMAYSKEYLTNDGILNKFQASLDFIATHTQFPHLLLKNSLQDMNWIMGWKNLDTGAREGTLNEASGVAVKDDVGKIRGKRLNFVIAEEFGSFANIREIYNILLPSIREGKFAFGTAYLIGCVCAGTKVWTNNGNLINIEQIKREDGIIGFNDGIINIGPVEGYINGCTRQLIGGDIIVGKKPCYRITLSNGNYIECSNDHPILINIQHRPRIKNSNLRYRYYSQEFVEADKIKIGDSVCEARYINIFGDKTLFDSRLVGMLIGDGTYGFDNTPVYSSEDAELLDYIKNKYDWSLSTSHTTKSNKRYEEIRVKGICKSLREIGIYGQTKTKKRLPDNFLELTRNDLSLLLSGIVDTDGCVYKNKKDYGINICQSSREILEEIRVAFRKFGVIGSITKTNPRVCRERKDKNPWYTLVMCGRNNILNLQKCLSLLVTRKSNKLLEGLEYYKQHKSLRNQKYPEQYLCYKVVSVEFLGEKDVYNLCASASHTYLANNIITHNTSGEKQSDFNQATEIIYNPKGYYMYALPNVYDKPGEGRKYITFFFPEYINRKGCYDENGNSDVIKALVEILLDRYRIKYNTTDLNTITRSIAERPITPQEALLKSRGNKFPVNELNQRLNELDTNSSEYDDVFVGKLVETGNGNVEFRPTSDTPIRIYPIENNMTRGALEIYCMPQKDSNGRVPAGRYIASSDPIDQDTTTDSTSLYSTFVMDLFTDNVVAEYTGRMEYAEQNYEVSRLLCMFYNCKILYEAHPISQKIITPDGEKLWGDIKIGDKLFDENGKITKVENILNRAIATIYEVTLGDGRKIKCSEDHIWSVYRLNIHPHEIKDYSTKELLKIGTQNKHKQNNFFIPTAKCVEYEHKDVLIDPYTLGLLIAEGSFTKFKKVKTERFLRRLVEFAAHPNDVEFYKTIIPYEIKHIGSQTYSHALYIDDIDVYLDSLGLLHKDSSTKFIPEQYLYNDKNVRFELLQGLMDGDGCAVKNGASVYVTISERLKDDIMSLCRSLGINCSYKLQPAHKMVSPSTGKIYMSKPSYRITIYSDVCLFKLPRKATKQHAYRPKNKGSKADAYIKKIAIKSIKFCGYEESFCISVDNPTGRYLIGDYVVTHNCNIKGTFSYFSKLGCIYLLADTPEYLQDKELLKLGTIGNTMKGVRATKAINNYADDLIREWMIQQETIIKKDEDGKEIEVTRKKLFSLRNRALIMEAIRYNNYENFDRIRAFGMLMLYREQFRIAAGGNIEEEQETSASNLAFDPMFTRIFNRGRS